MKTSSKENLSDIYQEMILKILMYLYIKEDFHSNN